MLPMPTIAHAVTIRAGHLQFFMAFGKQEGIQPINNERAHFCLYLILSFRKQTLQGANTDLPNPLDPTVHKSGFQNILFSLQIKPVNVS